VVHLALPAKYGNTLFNNCVRHNFGKCFLQGENALNFLNLRIMAQLGSTYILLDLEFSLYMHGLILKEVFHIYRNVYILLSCAVDLATVVTLSLFYICLQIAAI